ncbi:OmpA family protein [Cellulophaga sp. HaHa_2_1]|uniref:OmpA family protein n=1 Tax=Cellulophaga sp. HaHa_2_1 TaxID=2749994 RepID=UPI001C4F2A4D|nr:OmpA family protein [Cellulophaga sp. HaHa_2_1]QXP52466.1 OmpA family protein [Cellulophaga sp. HaHa_2_1]
MKKVILLFIIFSSTVVVAQSKEERADDHFKEFKFDAAIKLYKELASDKKKPSLHIIQQLADSYFNVNDYHNAKEWYNRLYTIQGKKIEEGNLIKLVQCLKADLEIEEADDVLKAYYTKPAKLKMILAQKAYLDSISKEKPRFIIENVSFNSEKSDFAPYIYTNGLVFASARDTLKSSKLYPWNKQPYLDLYLTNPKQTDYTPIKFLENMESDFHDATIALSWDAKTVYFTRNFLDKNKLSANADGLSNMQILKGSIVANELVNITSMSFNSKDYSCGHPAISADGNYMYFTSNMPGGYGASDIYRVELNSSGDAGKEPVNLGPTINTRGREMFPYVVNDVLYFSSDGHYGLGGLDIFASAIFSEAEFSLPLNRGEPINSNMDDFSYIREVASNNGYMASNRSGGVGDDDIYYYEGIQPTDCLEYSGTVFDEKTGEPLHEATVEIYDSEEGLVLATKTDMEGYYNFILPCNTTNKLVFSKKKYSKKLVTVTTDENPKAPSRNNKVYLTPFESLVVTDNGVEKIIVEPIYFDYDKYNITPRAEIQLEKVLFVLREFPAIKIKIESHTDARGKDAYNLKLSDNRAKATRDYLILKGIAAGRVESAYGYGENHLKNECSNGVSCSEQQHLVNRRSDFIIVSK